MDMGARFTGLNPSANLHWRSYRRNPRHPVWSSTDWVHVRAGHSNAARARSDRTEEAVYHLAGLVGPSLFDPGSRPKLSQKKSRCGQNDGLQET